MGSCILYSGLSLSRLPSISNISLSRTKCSVPWNFPLEHCIAFLYFELLYLELFSILNKFSGPLNHFLSLSRKFTYSNFIFDSRINWNLNQNKSFDRKWKKNLFSVFSVVKTKIPILQAMKILTSSWEAVSAQTIVNSFRKTGITP